MLNSAEEIIKYIGDAKKQTPVKVYLKGKNLPEATEFKISARAASIAQTARVEVVFSSLAEVRNMFFVFSIKKLPPFLFSLTIGDNLWIHIYLLLQREAIHEPQDSSFRPPATLHPEGTLRS